MMHQLVHLWESFSARHYIRDTYLLLGEIEGSIGFSLLIAMANANLFVKVQYDQFKSFRSLVFAVVTLRGNRSPKENDPSGRSSYRGPPKYFPLDHLFIHYPEDK